MHAYIYIWLNTYLYVDTDTCYIYICTHSGVPAKFIGSRRSAAKDFVANLTPCSARRRFAVVVVRHPIPAALGPIPSEKDVLAFPHPPLDSAQESCATSVVQTALSRVPHDCLELEKHIIASLRLGATVRHGGLLLFPGRSSVWGRRCFAQQVRPLVVFSIATCSCCFTKCR